MIFRLHTVDIFTGRSRNKKKIFKDKREDEEKKEEKVKIDGEKKKRKSGEVQRQRISYSDSVEKNSKFFKCYGQKIYCSK